MDTVDRSDTKINSLFYFKVRLGKCRKGLRWKETETEFLGLKNKVEVGGGRSWKDMILGKEVRMSNI